MTLKSWVNNKWLEAHQTSTEEIGNLLNKIEVNKMDLKIKHNSSDARLGFVYNNIITIATIALKVSGYRFKNVSGHHEKTIDSLRFTLNTDGDTRIIFQAIRKLRNTAEYDAAGRISEKDVIESIQLAEELNDVLHYWLKDNHPEYLE